MKRSQLIVAVGEDFRLACQPHIVVRSRDISIQVCSRRMQSVFRNIIKTLLLFLTHPVGSLMKVLCQFPMLLRSSCMLEQLGRLLIREYVRYRRAG